VRAWALEDGQSSATEIAEVKMLFHRCSQGQSSDVVGNSLELDTDIDVGRAIRWLIASAVVVFVCGILAIVLPLTFSFGVANLLGWLFIFAAVAHVIFGIHFASGTLGWHAFIAALYALAAINLLMNPLLGVVLLALVIGIVLVGEGIIEIVLFFLLREYRYVVWILIDGVVTLVLGIVACAHWPPASLELVQYLVGLSFISSGISRLLLGLALRVMEPTENPIP
jgi:membrane protein HdeD